MDNNRICANCGNSNNPDSKYCSHCGKSLVPNTPDDSNGNRLGIASILLFYGGPLLTTLLTYIFSNRVGNKISSLTGLFSLAGIVIMIIGRVKYPNNKLLKIIMWIIIGSIILSIIAIILFMWWCYITCSTIDWSGCD